MTASNYENERNDYSRDPYFHNGRSSQFHKKVRGTKKWTKFEVPPTPSTGTSTGDVHPVREATDSESSQNAARFG